MFVSLGRGRAPMLPWQRTVAAVAGEVLDSGRLAYPVVALLVPRRAGKTRLTLARQLQRSTRLDQHSWYTAQRREDAAKQFRDEWLPAVEGSDYWNREAKIRRAQGSESIKHRQTGSTIQLFPPTESALHGQNADDVTVDEAWFFDLESGLAVEAGIRPAQWTRPQRQLWVISAGGTELSTWLDSWITLGRTSVDEGRTDGLAYFEWSADPEAPDYDPTNPAIWRRAHPALGWTLPEDVLAEDLSTTGIAAFERSVLNVWPRPGDGGAVAVSPARWAELADPDAAPAPPFVFVVDVARDRSFASIVVAGAGGTGVVVELVAHRRGTEWVPEALDQLRTANRSARFVGDELVVASIVADLQRAGWKVARADPSRRRSGKVIEVTGAADMARSCGSFVDYVLSGSITHRAQPPLTAALESARRRNLADGFAWSRAGSTSPDISPLVAASQAAYQWRSTPTRRPPIVVSSA